MRFILNARRGFTLVELSIVIVIIGLSVAGVVAGQGRVKQAQLRIEVAERQATAAEARAQAAEAQAHEARRVLAQVEDAIRNRLLGEGIEAYDTLNAVA